MVEWPFKRGELKIMGFIQVDIAEHSKTLGGLTETTVMKLREDLSKKIGTELRKLGIGMVSWAGDGGVFAKECKSENDFGDLCKAAKRIFYVSNKINKKYKSYLKGKKVRLRVSSDCFPAWVHPNPIYWYSPQLNFFIKNEPKISFPDTFTITQPIYNQLSNRERKNFPEDLSFSIPNEEGHPIKLYMHSRYRYKIPPTRRVTFQEVIPPSNTDIIDSIIKSDPRGASYPIGDCVVFNQSLEDKGYKPYHIKLTFDSSEYQPPADLQKIIGKYMTEEDIKGDKLHYRIVEFKQPLTDMPIVECRLQKIGYSTASALQRALEEVPNLELRIRRNGEETTSLRDYLVSDLLDFPKSHMANFLVMQIVVITQAKGDIPSCIIFSQRGERVRYFPRLWTISLDEQMLSTDANFLECIRRGIQEELIGTGGSVKDISIQCFCIESVPFNQVIVACAEVPYTFEEVCERRRYHAPDAAETKCIIGVPLKVGSPPNYMDHLISILRSHEFKVEELPDVRYDPYSKKPGGERTWHPTSKLRLLMTLRKYLGLETLLQRLSQIK